jgi:hypothetical protein
MSTQKLPTRSVFRRVLVVPQPNMISDLRHRQRLVTADRTRYTRNHDERVRAVSELHNAKAGPRHPTQQAR